MGALEQPNTNETVSNAVETTNQERPLDIAENKFLEHQELIREKEGNENIRFLLGQKLSYLSTVSNVCMSWWVSSIVFCGSILAAVWVKREDLVESGIILYLGIVITLFLGSFPLFGVVVLSYLRKLEEDVSTLIAHLEQSQTFNLLPLKQERTFNSEIGAIRWGVIIGIGSFIVITLTWIALFLMLWGGHWVKSGQP